MDIEVKKVDIESLKLTSPLRKKYYNKNEKEILELLAKIKTRLEEINDGSFYVEDLATKEIEEL